MSRKTVKQTTTSMIVILCLLFFALVVFLSFQDIRPQQKVVEKVIEHEALK